MTDNRTSTLKRWGIIAGGLTAALLVGVGIGSADDTTAQPRTITETETVTETVEVERTPQACLDALDSADDLMALAGDGFDLAGQALGLSADAIDAIIAFDFAQIDTITAEVEGINDDMTAKADEVASVRDGYDSAAEQCRGDS